MSATIWLDADADETLELGGTLQLYRVFQEMADVAGPSFHSDWPQLFGVPSQTEDTADADPKWLKQVSEQAESFFQEYGYELSDGAKEVLHRLIGVTDNANPEGHNQYTQGTVGKEASGEDSPTDVAKLEAEVAPHLEKDANLRALSARVTQKVLEVGKTQAAKALTALAMKTCDQWLFETTVNAHQPHTTLTAKVSTLATVKAWFGIKKMLNKQATTNAEGGWDEADNLKAVMDGLAEASGGVIEAPELSEVERRLRSTTINSADQPRDAHGRWTTGEGTKDEHEDAVNKEWERITGGKPKDFKASQLALRQAKRTVGEWTPHEKQGRVDLNDSTAFAKMVHQAAKEVPDAISGKVNDGKLESWESHKPLVADVHEHMKKQLGNVSLDDFKSALLKAHQEGKLELSRNDLPQSTKDTAAGSGLSRTAKSEIKHGSGRSEWDSGNVYHTIDTNSRASKQ